MPPEQEAAFLAQNRQGEVYAVHISFFVLMMLIVPARFASARAAKKPLSWDDWLALVAAISTVGVFIGTMLWLRFGLGRHAAVVMQEDPNNIPRFFQTIVANEILYTTGLACARLSLVAFFYRIFGVLSMRFFLHGFVFVIIAWAISTYVPSIRTCWPIESFWDGTNQNCIDIFKFYVGVAIGGITTDFGLMILPIPYIWRLSNVPRYQKVLVMCTLIFGGFACFVTIIRLVKITQLDLTDPTWGTVDLMIWTGMEVYSAVICCCLPTLRPLVKVAGRYLGKSNWSSTPADSHPNGVWTSPRGPERYSKNPASNSVEEILHPRSAGDLELSTYDPAESIK